MEIKKDGSIIAQLLVVESYYDDKGNECIRWHYGDKPNAYYLMGVMQVIIKELIDEINEQSDSA